MSAADRGAWCTRCGSPGTVLHETLDARRPVGRCRRQTDRGEGCGVRVLTRLLAEADAAELRWKRHYVTARHKAHKEALRPYLYCDRCQAETAAGDRPDPGPVATGV